MWIERVLSAVIITSQILRNSKHLSSALQSIPQINRPAGGQGQPHHDHLPELKRSPRYSRTWDYTVLSLELDYRPGSIKEERQRRIT